MAVTRVAKDPTALTMTIVAEFDATPERVWELWENPRQLERWWLIPRNRWFNIYLHHFLRSDDDRALHDHMYVNVSILLSGSYFEHLADGTVEMRMPWRPWYFWRLVPRLPKTAHRIELIDNSPVWTLFITGPRVREWGFHCPKGWVPWHIFTSGDKTGSTIGKGCE